MRQASTLVETMRCNLIITNKARKGIEEWSNDEHAFFKMQQSFEVHIEKRPANSLGNTSLSLYFDNETNETLTEKLDGKVAVMECILQNDGLLATGFYVRGSKVRVRTNRRLSAKLQFNTARNNGTGMPIQLHTKIRELPVAEERSEYVKKRIASWEGYLQIQERNADVADITATYSRFTLNEDFSKMTLVCNDLSGNDTNKIRGLSVSLKGFQQDIGEVLKADKSKKTVEIELRPKFRDMARRNQWQPKLNMEVVFSNFASLSQIRRLRKGFEDLQNGLAANPNLEQILFEDRPKIRVTNKREELEFHNNLNEFQQEAVRGAMDSEDLYVIQGPPGTGKTTVISEICYQNAKAGFRTLVASQSNLAVDNALSRLLSHKDIRILRFGRTESIEEEGKKFIEENVGLYWKTQTLADLNEQLQSHDVREAQLEAELNNCEDQIQLLQTQLVVLKEKIKRKQQAKVEHLERSDEIKNLKKSLIIVKKEQEKLLDNEAGLTKTAEGVAQEIERLEQLIASQLTVQQLSEKKAQVSSEITQIQDQLVYCQTTEEIKHIESALQIIKNDYQHAQRKKVQLEEFTGEIQAISKLDILKSRITHYDIAPSSIVEQRMTSLETLIETIKSFAEWDELNKRLLSSIDYMEKLLKKHNFPVETLQNRNSAVFDTSYSVKEIHQFIDRMKQFLTSDSNDLNMEKLTVFLEGLYVRRKFVWKKGAVIQREKANTTTMFSAMKDELAMQIKSETSTVERSLNEFKQSGASQKQQLGELLDRSEKIQSQLESLPDNLSLPSLQLELQEKQSAYDSYVKMDGNIKHYSNQLAEKQNTAEATAKHLTICTEALEEIEAESKRLNSEGLEQQRQLKSLEEILEQNLEEERDIALTEINSLSEKVVSLKKEKVRLPITQALQKEWFSLLQDANEYDLDEIRKLYVKHGNVIGTTCVASARKEFMDNYPTFDVVIIDEVSKATPPELLLPMLKGKKVILVGDHHQLPPLLGEDTLEELLEENDNTEEKNELKKLLKESLFERLFKNLPVSNKTMLAIQYRMHESIMETITPFYEEGNYRLQCGLTDSDSMRDHLLDSPLVKRTDHLLWLDMPNKPAYFEEKVKGGTSRYNQAELEAIRKMLMDLDKATEQAKKEGRMNKDDKKSVGVISFYGEQVKRIDRLIQQETSFSHLTFRTGTVDKFQGMEMDVILLSMVRNTDDRKADIGFAKDYRRLNVALSRARELLVVIGSADMFTLRARQEDSRKMYGRLLKIVQEKNGYRSYVGGNV
ncbi:AAA domain-containing protein [Psychrobacillus sp.]|uniref:DEAD/DEAH box helicase n=1 Tax=Psychrobacillus sp. TaxID=1871623 RepID=UPI0028BDC7FD|nr:AAA domain-containing protein [Psychrobacillus sp.]